MLAIFSRPLGDIVDAADRLGIAAANVYGSSEVFAFAALSERGAARADRAMPGGSLDDPGMEVRVVDPATGWVLAIGEVGELQFRSETLSPAICAAARRRRRAALRTAGSAPATAPP